MNANLIQAQVERPRPAEVVQLAENAFESARLPRATKDHYIAELTAYAWPLACCSQLFRVRSTSSPSMAAQENLLNAVSHFPLF